MEAVHQQLAQQDELDEVTDRLLQILNQGVTWQNWAAAGIILVGSVLIAWLARRIIRWGLRRYLAMPEFVGALIGRVVGWIVIALGIIYALEALGVTLSPVLAVILIVGLVLLISSRGFFQNLFAGIVLQARGTFERGHDILTNDVEGTVEDIDGRNVVIATPDGKRAHVPNTEVLNGLLVNYTEAGALRSTVEVGVAYGTDLDEARRVMIDALSEVEGVQEKPPPAVLLHEFGESSINASVWFWHEPTILAGWEVRDRVMRGIKAALEVAGITIAFPQRTLWWGQETGQPSAKGLQDQPPEPGPS